MERSLCAHSPNTQPPKTTDATHTDGHMAALPGTAAVRKLVEVLLSESLDMLGICSAVSYNLHLFWIPQPLIKAIGSEDEKLQEAAAGCVRNIRLMVKAYMEAKLFK